MTRILHCAICVVAFFMWGVGNLFYTLACFLCMAANKVEPNSKWGNCWTFASVRWVKQGGYLMVRPADKQRFLGVFPVPHAIWVEVVGDGNILKQFIPVKRMTGLLMPLHTIYYCGKVQNFETPHNARAET
jgi:hypothetical protein